MLFNYNKGNGLKNGLTIGDTPIGSLFKNNNLQLLNQGNNRKFLSDISEGFSGYDSEDISNLAKDYKDVDAAVIKFAQDQKLANASGKELIQTFEMQGTALYKFKGVMQGLGDSVGKILASIGNAVVSMGISIAASLIIAGIQKIVNHAKELHEEVQNITSTYSETTKKLVDNRKEFDELSQKYNELSDGVNTLGQNVSLTESEFEEYHTITNKIADMVPDLVSGWDEQGNAILRVKGNVEGLSQAYDEEMIKANNAIIKDSDKITKDTKKQIKKLGGQEEFDDLSLLNDVLSGKLDITPESDLNKIVDTLIKSGVDVGVGMESLDKIYDFGDDQEYAKALSIYLKNLSTDEKNIISAYVKEHEATLSDGMSSARELLKSEISNNQLQDYKNLNDELKSVMNSIANTISDEELYKLSQGKGGKNGNQDIGQYVEELYSTLSELSQADLKDIEAGINLSTQWNNDEIPYDEYIQKVQAFVKLLETLFPDNKDIVETFKVLFDIPDEEELAKQQDIFVNRLGKKVVSGKKSSTTTSNSNPILDQEKQKLVDWGKEVGKDYTQFEDDIESGVLHKFGNVDMDKRAIIKWSDELKKTYEKELASWEYDPEIGSIDTVWGQSTAFEWDNQEHEIAFTPIMETEDGAVFLGEKEVYDYINSVIAKAGEDGEITADEIFKIDAVETGKQYGEQFGKGLIAGVDESTGNVGINAIDAGNLMHFSGKYGAVKLAKDAETTYAGASKAGMPSDVEDKLKNQYTEVADTWYDSLTKSQREFVDNISDEDLAEAVKFDSTEQFDEWLKKCQNEAVIEADVTIKSSDAVNSMADMKNAVSSLGDLYNQTVNMAVVEGQATGYADPALLNSIESAFGQFSEKLKSEGNEIAANSINKALEDFEDTLVRFPNDAAKAQEAIDILITKYIDQTDAIKNLTEENKEWSIEQLKAMGITNAEEVVQSRLSQQVKETQKAINSLSEALEEYNKALESGDEAAKADAISSLVDPTKDALTIRDVSGQALTDGSNKFLENINSGFVQSHLADIQAMADGDIEALNRVRLAAAQGAVMEVTTNIPTEAAEAQIRGLMDMVAQADAMSIEPGASIDDTAFISALNNMIASAGYTQRQVNTAFESMGYDVKFKNNSYPVELVNYISKHGANGMPTSVVQKMRENISVPSVEIISKKGSSGGGVRASYGGGSSKSSGGGRGGGGGGGGGSSSGSSSEPTKPQEEAEDSFDWIEVAIQRIEEEIERLDKVVNNSYTTWTKRNSALAKELQKTKDEIKAQVIAQQEYTHYLGTIKVNNGKGLNADDYGENDQLVKQQDQRLLDEARRLWATGQYQRKIQNGQMTGNDIEKIQNHFLVDTINEYKEM